MKKKILATTIVLTLAISILAACGSNKENDGSGTPDVNTNENVETQALEGESLLPEDAEVSEPTVKPTLSPDEEQTQEILSQTDFPENSKAEAYYNMFMSGEPLYLKARIVEDDSEMEVYFKDNMFAIVGEEEGVAFRMISRDGRIYYMDDVEKSYMSFESDEDMAMADIIGGTGNIFLAEGEDEFDDKVLFYEEYIDRNGYNGSTKWFFEGDTLAGMRNIDNDGIYDIVFLALESNVSDSVFDIPADYTEMSLDSFGDFDYDLDDAFDYDFDELEDDFNELEGDIEQGLQDFETGLEDTLKEVETGLEDALKELEDVFSGFSF